MAAASSTALSAFSLARATNVTPNKKVKGKVKVTAVAVDPDAHVAYVGLNCGLLLVQSLDDASAETQRTKTLDPHLKKKISALLVLPAPASLLLVNLGGVVSVYKVPNLTRAQKHLSLSSTDAELKPITHMAATQSTLAVSVGKVVHTFAFDESSGTPRFVHTQPPLVPPPHLLDMVLADQAVLFASAKMYSFLSLHDPDNPRVLDLEKPLGVVARVPAGSLPTQRQAAIITARLDKEYFAHFYDFEGSPCASPVAFAAKPVALACCGEYLVAVLGKNQLEVWSLSSPPSLMQSHTLEGDFSASSVSVSAGGTHVVVTSSSLDSMHVLTLSSVETRVSQYLELGQVDKAKACFMASSPSHEAQRDFYAQVAFTHMKHLRFDRCTAFLALAQLDPRSVSQLDMRGQWELELPSDERFVHRHAPQAPDSSTLSLRKLLRYGQQKLFASALETDKRVSELDVEDIYESALLHLACHFWSVRGEQQDDGARTTVDNILLFIAVKLGFDQRDSVAATEGARRVFFDKVQAARHSLPPDDKSVAVEQPYTVEGLLFPRNHVDVDAAITFLQNERHLNTSALLQLSTGSARNAFAQWKLLGSLAPEHRDKVDVALAPGAANDTDLRDGVVQTIKYLSQRPFDDLVREFSVWVLRDFAQHGMRIFTSRDLAPKERLEIIDFLDDERVSQGTEFDHVEAFLSYVVHDTYCEDPDMHNRLALRLLASLADADHARADDLHQKLVHLLHSSERYDVEHILAAVQELPRHVRCYDELIILYSRLDPPRHVDVLNVYVRHLHDDQGARDYCIDRPEEIIHQRQSELDSHVARNAAQAEVDKMRSEMLVDLVRVYLAFEDYHEVLRDEDFDAQLLEARQERTVRLRESQGPLLQDSRQDDAGETLAPNVRKALSILLDYAPYIDPLEVLSILPPDLPVEVLNPYFKLALPNVAHRRRTEHVTSRLVRSEHKQVRHRYDYLRSQRVVVSKYDTCASCGKYFTADSIFTVLPGSERRLVHQSCKE